MTAVAAPPLAPALHPRRGIVDMPFMVIYRTSDGSSNFEQADAIDEAALFVERLRNKEGIDQIRIYRMEEISFAFRPYYKVELGMPDRVGDTPEVERADDPGEAPPVAPIATMSVGPDRPLPPPPGAGLLSEDGAVNGERRGLFGR